MVTPTPTVLVVCASGCRFSQVGQAIQAARDGQEVLVEPGVYRENLVIDKSVVVRGAGSGQTLLEAGTPSPGVRIRGGRDVVVALSGLRLAQSENLRGGSAGCIPQPESCRNGVIVSGNVQADLTDILISGNADTGLWVTEDASVTLTRADISRNGTAGVAMAGTAQLTVGDSNISENRGASVISAGIRVGGQAKLTLVGSTVARNSFSGVWILDGGSADISNTVIRHSAGGFDLGAGLVVDGTATVTVQGSTIDENGTDTRCLGTTFESQMCNGVLVSGLSSLTVVDSTIERNTDWGIGARLRKCGHPENLYAGDVVLLGNNSITENHRSRRDEVARGRLGQACLP